MPAADVFDIGSAAADVASIGETLIQGAQIVGGVLSIAGALTGNKRLMQAGAVLGIGATAISALSSLGDTATTGGIGGMKEYGSAPSPELQSYADEAASASEAAGLANTSPEAMAELFGPEQSFSNAAPSPGLIESALGSGNDLAAPDAMASAAQAQALTPPDYSPSNPVNDIEDGVKIKESSIGSSTAAFSNADKTLNSQPQSLIGRAMGWLNDRENAGLIKLGTGLIGGAMQGYQQERALEEQQRARDEQRQYIEDKRRRFNQSILNQHRHS